MKRIKNYIVKYGSSLAAVAFIFNAMAIRPFCVFFFHEAEVPEELMEYKKNK